MFRSVKINGVPFAVCSVLCVMLVVAVCCLNVPNINHMPVSAEIETKQTCDVPIIMYHAVSDIQEIQGDYVISSSEFESDLTYLTKNGYNFVFVKDLVDFVNEKTTLPENPIVLSFDDGYYNNYLYAYPLIEKYNAKISLSPIAYCSELYTQNGEVNESYTHCTWEMLTEMCDSGLVELGSHSYNLHTCNDIQKGIGQMRGESDENYTVRITDDITLAQDIIEKNTGRRCEFIAYPFGIYNGITEDVVRSLGFKAALTCSSGINHLEQGDTDTLYELKRLIRPHNSGIENILK